MKNIYFLLIAFIGLTFTAEAQVIAYHENFNNSVTGVTTNFTRTTAAAYADTLYTGGSNMQAAATSSQLVINNSISTYNLNNLTITWKEYRTQYWRKSNGQQDISTYQQNANFTKIDNTNPITLEYSLDGTTYVKVGSYTASPDFFTWAAVNNKVAISLPAAVENKVNVRFRWTISVNNANTDFYALDDIMIKGTPVLGTSTFSWASRPVNENPFTTSAAATNPYKVDGVTLQWATAAIGTGVTIETGAVSTNYQKKNTLTLIQAGASTNTGTEVSLQLSHSVSGLTFNILDVDRAAGQFKDKVQVIGYNGSQRVSITKNSVLPRIANEYSAGLLVAKSDNVDGVDSKVNSSKGNVTISFVADVDRVVIQYYNDDAAKGRQGIAISDVSWGTYDAAIGTLPVELISFKGESQNGNAKLTWATASEHNNDKFLVERSQDGKVFSQVGEVKGNGNSSTATSYSFTDTNPAAGVNYYRLRQVDFDGAADFSKTIALTFAQQAGAGFNGLASVYPTVAASDVTISLNTASNANIVVADATGRTVAAFTNVAGRELVVPVQHLNQGVYFVTVTDGQQRETQRFVKR